MLAPSSSQRGAGFSLVETVIAMVIVATMFVAAMSTVATAARDRQVQAEQRTGEALASMLIGEITSHRFSGVTSPAFGRAVVGTNRLQWRDVDDYFDLNESPPRDRAGTPIPGATGWRWQATVTNISVPDAASVASSTANAGDLVTAGPRVATALNLNAAALNQANAANTGLRRIVVTVTSPRGKPYVLTALRCSAGVPDRVASGSGFVAFGSLTLQVGPEQRLIEVAAPFMNTPPQ